MEKVTTAAELFEQLSTDDTLAKTRESVVKELVAKGGKLFTGLKVRSVTVTPFEGSSSIGVAMTVNGQILGRTVDGTIGITSTVMSTGMSLAAVAKDDPCLAIFASQMMAGSDVLSVILTGGTIDVVCQLIPAGDPVVNPFSLGLSEAKIYSHDLVLHHVVGITAGPLTDRLIAAKLSQF